MDTTRTRVSLAALVFLISGLFGCTPVAAQYGGVIGTAQIDRANSKTSWFDGKLRVSVRVRTKPSHLSPIIESLSTIRYFASFADRKIDAKAFQSFDIPHTEARTTPRRTLIFESDAANIPNQRYINIEFQACWSTRHGQTKGAALVGRSTCKTDQALIALPFNGRPKSKPVAQQVVNETDGASIAAHEPLQLTVDKFTTTSSLLYFDATLSGVSGFPQSSFTLTAAGRDFIARRITPRKNKLASYKSANIMLPLDLIGTQLHVMTVKNPGRPDIKSLRVEFSQYGNRAQHVAATAVLAPKLIMTGMIDEDMVGGAGIDSVASEPSPPKVDGPNPIYILDDNPDDIVFTVAGEAGRLDNIAILKDDVRVNNLKCEGKRYWLKTTRLSYNYDEKDSTKLVSTSFTAQWNIKDSPSATAKCEGIKARLSFKYKVPDPNRYGTMKWNFPDPHTVDVAFEKPVVDRPEPVIKAIAFHGDGDVANLVKVRISKEPKNDTEVKLAWDDTAQTPIDTLIFTPINWETWQVRSITIPSGAGGSEGESASKVVASIGDATDSIDVKGVAASQCMIKHKYRTGWHVAGVGKPDQLKNASKLNYWNMPAESTECIVDVGEKNKVTVNLACEGDDECEGEGILSCFEYNDDTGVITHGKVEPFNKGGDIQIDGNCWVYWDEPFTITLVPSTQ